MNKCISYSIFRGDCEEFEFKSYLRGVYFNARMNRLIYPSWRMVVLCEESVYQQYSEYIYDLSDVFKINYAVLPKAPLCQMMLWRLFPIWAWEHSFDYVLCRDSDALTTYREAQLVDHWITENHDSILAILDNPAHSGLMGGMVAFHANSIRKEFPSFEDLIKGSDLNKRGSDQDLLNNKIYPVFKNFIHWEDHKSNFNKTAKVYSGAPKGVSDKLWESNLCAAFIGAPGFNELETLRFLKRFDKTDYSDFEKRHKDLFWWV